MKGSVFAIIVASLCSSHAFTTRSPITRVSRISSTSDDSSTNTKKKPEYDDGNMLNGFKAGFNILKKGMNSGDGFKQSLADAMAGPELNLQAANDIIDAYISKSPVVVFSWTVSSFSSKAKKLLTSIGATYEAVELDQPWSDGNPIRAALGRRLGRTSVPAIFINGVYIGGCDDGPTPEAPGLIPMAFQGKLRPALIAAGALKEDATVDFKSTHSPATIIETKAVEVASSKSIVKLPVGAPMAVPVAGARDTIVSSVVSQNQKKAVPFKDPIVSSTVTKNQKISAPKDLFVSSTVTDNQKNAMNGPKAFATPAPVKAIVAAVAAAVASITGPAKVEASPKVEVSAGGVKSAKGFYSKNNVVVEDELCPVEEECEL